ncbi:hypothetical protein [Streptacidiphilus jiangxiensis]|uniref:Uncharacterized protein n=1 Tax=Streptacidiphilus jiangxiensis TaxID=235985 RepID=A0A1H8BNH4_STRJI|nr:hypothetical protein [Streptacidiphilus jiangxiensis]SEM84451.1 hypothetical protein SAMN05414137_1733 [Streptacidiphilus jiangxiensis]
MRRPLLPDVEQFAQPGSSDWRPEWVPQVWTTRLPAGRFWEAVRVAGPEAQQALDLLGADIGPVISNPYAQVSFFLLDQADGPWVPTRTARLLRHGTVVAIPQWHVRSGRDVHWAVPPGRGTTDPGALREALVGPRPQPRRIAPPAVTQRPKP